MAAHAKLSPSAARRWLVCPASATEATKHVSPDTEDSLQGTAGHWVYAEWLENGEPPKAGAVAPNGVVITDEMIELAGEAVGWVRQYIKSRSGKVFIRVEERVNPGAFYGLKEEEFFGTADTAIVSDEVCIIDLKLGWQEVLPEENPQLACYALGVCEEAGWLWEKLRFVILQPRNGGAKEWETTKTWLLDWAVKQEQPVREAASGVMRYVPTEDGCRYCPAAGTCRALQQNALELARREFSDEVVTHLSPEEMSTILTKADLVESAIKAIRERALKLLESGVTVPGWKVVEGRKNRTWREGVEATVIAAAADLDLDLDRVAPRKLISPAQMEKVSKSMGTFVEQFAEKPRGAPVLAPETDKRPALPPVVEAVDMEDKLLK